jgi:hypothetical protein
MKLGNIKYDTSPPMLPLQGRFLPVVNAAPEEAGINPPSVLDNVSQIGVRLCSTKRVALENFYLSADEGNDTESDCVSPKSLNRSNDNVVAVRTKTVTNSSLWMQVRCLTDKLAASKNDLDQANEKHDIATNMVVSLKQDVRDYEGVADELEFSSGTLVNAKDELVCARMEIEKMR